MRHFMTLLAANMIDPWGPEREDARMVAMLMAIYGSQGVKVPAGKCLALVNPWHADCEGTPSRDELRRKIHRFNAGLGITGVKK